MTRKQWIQTMTAAAQMIEDLDDMEDAEFDFMEVHTSEKARVQKFYEELCKCKLAKNKKACSTPLTLDDFFDCRKNSSELSSTELDLVLLGAIHSLLNCNEISTSGRAQRK